MVWFQAWVLYALATTFVAGHLTPVKRSCKMKALSSVHAASANKAIGQPHASCTRVVCSNHALLTLTSESFVATFSTTQSQRPNSLKSATLVSCRQTGKPNKDASFVLF